MITAKPVCAVLDYGIGNVSSLHSFFRELGFRCIITRDRDILISSDLVVLPGVGSFPPVIQSLTSDGTSELIQHRHHDNKPILGICLGMQLLSSSSTESGFNQGLSILPGNTVMFNDSCCHIGWNSALSTHQDTAFHRCFTDNHYYFNHSYYIDACPSSALLSTTHYNGQIFPSAIQVCSTVGIQFHPEKSQSSGINLIKTLYKDLLHAL